jgi:Protein of unknown function (DUF1588)/Protein of unknown function (DUF1592)/Protein of unknown function (DUF1595)/Protein of unknown function (DUF1585)
MLSHSLWLWPLDEVSSNQRLLLWLFVSLSACTGSFSWLNPVVASPEPTPMGGVRPADNSVGNGREPCAAVKPSNRPDTFRQLTRSEYLSTAQFLAEGPLSIVDSLPVDGETRHETGVVSNIGVPMDDQRFANFSIAAQRVATATVSNLKKAKSCVVSTARSIGPCLTSWISALGSRAFRRPLTAGELESLKSLNMNEADPEAAAALVVEALALSPQFLFHVELGAGTTQDRLALTPFEVAARLSYFVTGGPPSPALFEAAQQGQLQSDAQLGQWAKTLLESAAGKSYQAQQVAGWLGVSSLSVTEKSPDKFPEFTPAIKAAMLLDSNQLVEKELLSGAYGFADFLVTERRYFGSELEPFYTGSSAGERIGPLMQPAWLTQHSGGNGTSPTKRGKFMTERMLCQKVSLPPPGLTIPPIPKDDGTFTTRERFETHGLMSCARGCHDLMDPLGFSLESFDAIGRERARENGKPVNTTGAVEIKDVVLSFGNARELITAIGKSTAFHDCVTEQWVERALAVSPREEERCQTEAAADFFRSSGGSLESLIVGISTSPMFRTKGMCTQ